MDNARIENDNVVFPARWSANGDDVFSFELLERLNELGRSFYRISDALHFYNIVKDAPEWRWSTPEELDGVDLTGWEIHYYESNWEDSCWNVVWTTTGVVKSQSEYDDGHYNALNLQGEANSWSFYRGQSLLLVKLTDDVFRVRREESESDAIEGAAEEAAWEAAEEQREAERAQRYRANADDVDSDPLKEWEAELLGIVIDDEKPDVNE